MTLSRQTIHFRVHTIIEFHVMNCVVVFFLEKGKTKIIKPHTFWKWKHISKRNHILKMKAHSETHFENESTFLEKWKVINPFLSYFFPGLCISALVTRPDISCGHPSTVIFQLLGEFPSFILSWLDILIHLTLVSACRYFVSIFF